MKKEDLLVYANGQYDALYISKCLLKIATDKDIKVSNMKLQKLLYFVQGMFFVHTNHVLFEDDFVAWNYGPVVPEVYYKYKSNCSEAIAVDSECLKIENIDEEISRIISAVLDFFGNKNVWDLVDFTHKFGPWKYYHNKQNNVIPKTEITNFFSEIKQDGQ